MKHSLRRLGLWILDQTDPGPNLDPRSRALITQGSDDIDEAARLINRASMHLSRALIDAKAANLVRRTDDEVAKILQEFGENGVPG